MYFVVIVFICHFIWLYGTFKSTQSGFCGQLWKLHKKKKIGVFFCCFDEIQRWRRGRTNNIDFYYYCVYLYKWTHNNKTLFHRSKEFSIWYGVQHYAKRERRKKICGTKKHMPTSTIFFFFGPNWKQILCMFTWNNVIILSPQLGFFLLLVNAIFFLEIQPRSLLHITHTHTQRLLFSI